MAAFFSPLDRKCAHISRYWNSFRFFVKVITRRASSACGTNGLQRLLERRRVDDLARCLWILVEKLLPRGF
jgi:hypothetical protein